MAKTGRPPSCLCGECAKCKRRVRSRARYQTLSLDERRDLIAKRDKEKVRAADRARYYRQREERQARMQEWAEKNREKGREIKKAHYLRYPDRSKARYTLGNAVRDGKVQRQPCEKCGNPKSHAHHWDYTKPLDVIWLCSEHHGEVHRQYPTTLRVEDAA